HAAENVAAAAVAPDAAVRVGDGGAASGGHGHQKLGRAAGAADQGAPGRGPVDVRRASPRRGPEVVQLTQIAPREATRRPGPGIEQLPVRRIEDGPTPRQDDAVRTPLLHLEDAVDEGKAPDSPERSRVQEVEAAVVIL